MPQQLSRSSARPITSFSFTPDASSNQAPKSNERSGGGLRASSKSREDGQRGELEGGGRSGRVAETTQNRTGQVQGRPAGGLKPLNSFAPNPPTRQTPSRISQSKPPSKTVTPLAAPPPRPSSTPSTSIGKPPLKRRKRVLATDQELQEWSEGGAVRQAHSVKGKERAVKESLGDDAKQGALLQPDKESPPTTEPSKPAPSSAKAGFRPLSSTFGVFSPVSKPSPFATSLSKPSSRASPAPSPAMHRLSSFSPFPSSSSTPAKSRLSTSQATPVTRLFGQLPSPSKRGEDEKKPLERRSILALAPAAPTSVTEDAGAVMEVSGYEGLSPGKKTRKGAFLLSGIASRAATLLNSSKTDQTLWLHDFARSLNSLTLPAFVPDLLVAVPPALRLKIVSLPSANTLSTEYTTRNGQKALLAQCRIELDDASPTIDPDAPSMPDLVGLVLFSLHSFASSSVLPPPSPVKPRKPLQRDDGRRSLHVPTNPYDLQRFLARKGGEEVEVWAWEPFYPIDLLALSDKGVVDMSLERAAEGMIEEEGAMEGDGVAWDEEVGKQKEQEAREARAADRSKKALVVGRFAVLL